MIAYIVCLIDMWFTAAECKRRESYLAESKDLSEVERRIRALISCLHDLHVR
ncbi:DUF3563 domain-containing protein [Caballeronia sp. ATUFL_M2_KS44]|uniref:DUF3563 domain-containing protein n=1 Tax=Caballeronia sp. ATUFL_M2_KS44 TaxID=2921767 RepID=UPI00202874F8|nr:DUF3563 domain-containing protein [Caballeronia sp. ATUFL_M2_KS44]